MKKAILSGLTLTGLAALFAAVQAQAQAQAQTNGGRRGNRGVPVRVVNQPAVQEVEGNVSITGPVQVAGPVEVAGSVEIEGPIETTAQRSRTSRIRTSGSGRNLPTTATFSCPANWTYIIDRIGVSVWGLGNAGRGVPVEHVWRLELKFRWGT